VLGGTNDEIDISIVHSHEMDKGKAESPSLGMGSGATQPPETIELRLNPERAPQLGTGLVPNSRHWLKEDATKLLAILQSSFKLKSHRTNVSQDPGTGSLLTPLLAIRASLDLDLELSH